jgi:diguanylate cyclase (GGDEF)-like protein
VHPDDLPGLIAGWTDALARGAEYGQEFRLRMPDGGERWVSGRAAPLRDDAGAVTGAVGTIEDVHARKLLESELTRRATQDALTGLANRAHFHEGLAEALARGGGGPDGRGPAVAVLLLDLDDFKTVNDSLGHPAGDRLLTGGGRTPAARHARVRHVARLGGDEFAVLLRRVRSEAECVVVAERIAAALEAPVALDGRAVRVRGSVGIARATAASDADALLRDADLALYAPRGRGRAATPRSRPTCTPPWSRGSRWPPTWRPRSPRSPPRRATRRGARRRTPRPRTARSPSRSSRSWS